MLRLSIFTAALLAGTFCAGVPPTGAQDLAQSGQAPPDDTRRSQADRPMSVFMARAQHTASPNLQLSGKQ